MSNEMMIFRNDAFSDVRTVMIDGEPWFAATDVTRILGYKNCCKAMAVGKISCRSLCPDESADKIA